MNRATLCWALAVAIFAAAPAAAINCFPTCAPDDGRFLAVEGGLPLSTLSAVPLKVRLEPPAGADSFVVGIFDGDCGAADGWGTAHWDVGASPATFTLRPCSDPDCTLPGAPRQVFSSTAMPDNAWFEFVIDVEPGDAAYRLTMELPPAYHDVTSANQLKVRSEGRILLGEAEQPFSFMALYYGAADLGIVYPRFDLATWNDFEHHMADARYDGTFTILQEVEIRSREWPLVLQLWNGDLDHGSWDLMQLDSDDGDTPSGPTVQSPCPEELLPPFYLRPDMPAYARWVVCSEGVAIGEGSSTGAPWDEADPHWPLTGPYPGINRYACRPPSVYVVHTSPDGAVYRDPNPSGNREWERFCVSELATLPPPFPGHPPMKPDEPVAELAAGVWVTRVVGMDHNNLNAWYCGCSAVPEPGDDVEPGAPKPCECTVLGTGPEGCTPGYWKNHVESWILYEPHQLYDDVFGVYSSTNPTLLQALRARGGGEFKLMRHATAALLSAAAPGHDYYYGMAEIIAMVQEAYSTGEFERVGNLFEAQNETRCEP